MKTEFAQVETRKEALATCPWASAIKRVDGGYMCFESVDDAKTHEKQK